MQMLQPSIDEGRRQQHLLGLRPYRVFVILERRDSKQRFQEVARVELMPVKVETVTSSYTTPVGLQLGAGGMHAEGGIRLSEVSPLQVSEAQLRGKLQGRDLTSDERYFYEIVHTPWCAQDAPAQPMRFTLNGIPYHNGEKFCWEIELTDQELPRLPEGSQPDRDATHTHPRLKRDKVVMG